jgi:hypothetical protein
MRTQFQSAQTHLTLILALPLLAVAQSGDKSPTPVKAMVSEVTDTRSTGSSRSECNVGLTFTGDAVADSMRVHQVRLTKAQDELGRDLILAKADQSEDFANADYRSVTLRARVALRNPSRNASFIKIIEGEVDLFNPTANNGGQLVIKNAVNSPAEPIEDPTLKKYGIQLMYLTKDSYAAKVKHLEDKSDTATNSELDEAFGDRFKTMLTAMFASETRRSATLFLKDPEKRVIELVFLDASGKPLQRNGGVTSGEIRKVNLDAPIPADAQLLIKLVTPESIQTCPFKTENIPLP